ncbi:MAG: VWA domain-containing protein, partial [Limisphaerales bacterium]
VEPNLNLLRRLAEASGGKVLDPLIDNPFLHDRKKTFQPQDLWEWLLKISIILFVVDIAVRRIQLDQEQWQRLTVAIRRYVFFWKGAPRPAQADESLAALLNRRDHVRSQRPSTIATPAPDLFAPQKAPEPIQTATAEGSAPHPFSPPQEPEQSPAPQKSAESTTSRLLDAKRRARERNEGK